MKPTCQIGWYQNYGLWLTVLVLVWSFLEVYWVLSWTSEERCPIEDVALVVPETDDPSIPVMTFKAWFLGITTCTVLIFLNTFFTYRSQPLAISAILMQIAVLPIGMLFWRYLSKKIIIILKIIFFTITCQFWKV